MPEPLSATSHSTASGTRARRGPPRRSRRPPRRSGAGAQLSRTRRSAAPRTASAAFSNRLSRIWRTAPGRPGERRVRGQRRLEARSGRVAAAPRRARSPRRPRARGRRRARSVRTGREKSSSWRRIVRTRSPSRAARSSCARDASPSAGIALHELERRRGCAPIGLPTSCATPAASRPDRPRAAPRARGPPRVARSALVRVAQLDDRLLELLRCGAASATLISFQRSATARALARPLDAARDAPRRASPISRAPRRAPRAARRRDAAAATRRTRVKTTTSASASAANTAAGRARSAQRRLRRQPRHASRRRAGTRRREADRLPRRAESQQDVVALLRRARGASTRASASGARRRSAVAAPARSTRHHSAPGTGGAAANAPQRATRRAAPARAPRAACVSWCWKSSRHQHERRERHHDAEARQHFDAQLRRPAPQPGARQSRASASSVVGVVEAELLEPVAERAERDAEELRGALLHAARALAARRSSRPRS